MKFVFFLKFSTNLFVFGPSISDQVSIIAVDFDSVHFPIRLQNFKRRDTHKLNRTLQVTQFSFHFACVFISMGPPGAKPGRSDCLRWEKFKARISASWAVLFKRYCKATLFSFVYNTKVELLEVFAEPMVLTYVAWGVRKFGFLHTVSELLRHCISQGNASRVVDSVFIYPFGYLLKASKYAKKSLLLFFFCKQKFLIFFAGLALLEVITRWKNFFYNAEAIP